MEQLQSAQAQQTGNVEGQAAAVATEPEVTVSALKQNDRFRFDSTWGIIITILSILGIMLCLIFFAYFCCLSTIVYGSSLVGYLLLFSLLLLFALNLAFVATPNETSCGVRRFFLGVVYSAIFACMLVKSLNTWRKAQQTDKQPEEGSCFSRPGGLLVITLGLLLVQVLIASEWLILVPPAVDNVHGMVRCFPGLVQESHLVFSCVYVMLLLLLATIFSLLCWGSRENNHESRFTSLACVLSIVIWLAWTIVFTRVTYTWRDLVVCVGNLVNAYVILLCVFLRKVYVLYKLRRLEKQHPSAQSVSDIYFNQPLALSYPDLSSSKSHLGYEGGSQFQPTYEMPPPVSPLALPPPRPGSVVDYDGGSQFSPGYPMTTSQSPGYLALDSDAPGKTG